MKKESAIRNLFGFLLMTFLMTQTVLRAAVIEVANTSGQKMTVEIISYTPSNGNVRIKRADGQLFNTELSVFDAASQEKIIANAPKAMPAFTVDVSIGRRLKGIQDKNETVKNMTITTSVRVTNKSGDIENNQMNCTMVLVGRNSKRYADRNLDWYKVLSVQKFSTRLKVGGSSDHELKAIETTFDQSKTRSNEGGWEFAGYLLVGLNDDGKILNVKTTLEEVGKVTIRDGKATLAAIGLSEGTETDQLLTPRR